MLSIAFLSSILSYMPLSLLWQLMLAGAFMKYCFNCLENTSEGMLSPPDITAAYGGGLVLIFKMLAIIVAMGVAVYAVYRLVGPNAAGFLSILLIAGLPAVLIIFGMTDELSAALNPLNLIRLVSSIGLPYGLLLGFIMIMSASVGVLSEALGDGLTFVSMALQSIVSSYYTIVVFHIMGCMIFQYQGELGFTARGDTFEKKEQRSEQQRLAAKIDVTLKEGEAKTVLKLFAESIKKFPNDSIFNKSYFEYLEASSNSDELVSFASLYLEYLIRNNQEYQLRDIYKRILQVAPNFRPDSAVLRHKLAKACYDRGDFHAAVMLINGMHKQFPLYSHLLEAFELMAESLEHIPNKQKQVQQCRELLVSLEKTLPKVEKQTSFVMNEALTQPASVNSNQELEPTEHQGNQKKDLPPIEFKLE